MRFYVLRNPQTDQTDAVSDYIPDEDFKTGEAPRCPVCGRATGLRSWEPPYLVEMEFWGKYHGDIAFGTGDEFLVSERFKEIYQKTGLKGLYGFYPVEIFKVKPKRMAADIPNYYLAKIKYGSASVDIEASGFEYDNYGYCNVCKEGGLLKRGRKVVIIQETWIGDDIFNPKGLSGTIIATQRFKDFCDSKSLKNIYLIEAEKYSFDFYPWEKDK